MGRATSGMPGGLGYRIPPAGAQGGGGRRVTAITQPIVCPSLIGRAPQRDALARGFAELGARGGRVALVAGEAGVGKSRLVAEVRATIGAAAAGEVLVVQGQCF